MPNAKKPQESNEERGLCQYPNPADPPGPFLPTWPTVTKPAAPETGKKQRKRTSKES